jgi:ribonuclease BN (tRNA processing enzyme)
MRLTVLGSGGYLPTSTRQTSAYLLQHDRSALLLDAGTGVSRLVTEPGLLAGVDVLDVVVSHFHGDHVIGLSYLPELQERTQLGTLWVPGEPVYRNGPDLVRRVLRSPYQPFDPNALFAAIEPAGSRFDTCIGAVRTAWQYHHSDPSLGFRVEDVVAYCTDTPYDASTLPLASGVRLLLHEAWNQGPIQDASHSTAEDAARFAGAAGADRLLLTHVNPYADPSVLLTDARAVFAHTDLAEDRASVQV